MQFGNGSRARAAVKIGLAATAIVLAIVFGVFRPASQANGSLDPVAATVLAASNTVTGADDPIVLASPGRIEGQSEISEVGAGIDGVIQSIAVKEGQQVTRGQVLAELDCREIQSSLPLAKSEAESLRQVRVRLLRGSRAEEREAAAQRTAKAKTNLEHATNQLDRQRQLLEARTISKSAFEDARRDAGVAQSEYQLAIRDEALINAGPLAEEVAKADADVLAAEKRIALAEEKLSKCVVTAPMSGTVLRIMLRKGESFALVSPKPILTMADISGRRVRAEVDERDVSKVHTGQKVIVSSEAYAGRRFTGVVSRVASVMGRKSVLTGDPADKNDRDVLEVVAELEAGAVALPVGLRTTVQFHR